MKVATKVILWTIIGIIVFAGLSYMYVMYYAEWTEDLFASEYQAHTDKGIDEDEDDADIVDKTLDPNVINARGDVWLERLDGRHNRYMTFQADSSFTQVLFTSRVSSSISYDEDGDEYEVEGEPFLHIDTSSGKWYVADNKITLRYTSGRDHNGQKITAPYSVNGDILHIDTDGSWGKFAKQTMDIAVAVNSAYIDSPEMITVGGKKWMKQNLNAATAGSWCYANKSENCEKYGRLYTWDAAVKVCRAIGEGFDLPGKRDWNSLISAAGGASTAGTALLSSEWVGDDNVGFSGVPGGYREPNGKFVQAGSHGIWWSAEPDGGDNDKAHTYGLNLDDDNTSQSISDKSAGHSVRCVYSAARRE